MIPDISVARAVEVLRNGGVVAVPTETAYGLATDATNDNAVQKMYDIKGRAESKPILVLVNSLEMALQYAEFSHKALELAQKYWPGALTLVVPRRNFFVNTLPQSSPSKGEEDDACSRLSPHLNTQDNTIGIRWTSNSMCQDITTQLQRPITAPSANVSGMETCYTISEVQEQYALRGVQPDGIIDGGDLVRDEVSTVVKVVGNSVELLRQGTVKIKV